MLLSGLGKFQASIGREVALSSPFLPLPLPLPLPPSLACSLALFHSLKLLNFISGARVFFCVHVCMSLVHAWCLLRPEEGLRFSSLSCYAGAGTGTQRHSGTLTAVPSLQPPFAVEEHKGDFTKFSFL